jgi:hypothetical protein
MAPARELASAADLPQDIVFAAFRWGNALAEITLRLLSGEDEEKSFFLTQEFSADVTRLAGVTSRAPASASPEPGKRGVDVSALGQIIITAISSGAVSTLVTTIGSYLIRAKRTEVDISRPDGLKIKISSAKSNFEEIERTLRRLLLTMTGE